MEFKHTNVVRNQGYTSIGRIYREDLLENFEISRFEYITFDVAADVLGGIVLTLQAENRKKHQEAS